MRPHVLSCIESGKITPFPSVMVRPIRPAQVKKVHLYCDCRLPEDGLEQMAFCGKCRIGFIKVASPSLIMCSAVNTKTTGCVATVPFSFLPLIVIVHCTGIANWYYYA